MRKIGTNSLSLWLLPTALCFLGGALLIGCIPIPMKEKVITGTDYRRVFGERGQWLVDGKTTRQQVLNHLGPPQYKTDTGAFFGYFLQTNTGYWVQPLCFQGVRADQFRILLLQFKEDGSLQQHSVAEFGSGPYIFMLEKYDRHSIDAAFSGWASIHSRSATTMPSTQPE